MKHAFGRPLPSAEYGTGDVTPGPDNPGVFYRGMIVGALLTSAIMLAVVLIIGLARMILS